MKSFSLAPACGDAEGDETAVKPSSTLRILNFFISLPVRLREEEEEKGEEEDEAPETRSPVSGEELKEEGSGSRSRFASRYPCLNRTC